MLANGGQEKVENFASYDNFRCIHHDKKFNNSKYRSVDINIHQKENSNEKFPIMEICYWLLVFYNMC